MSQKKTDTKGNAGEGARKKHRFILATHLHPIATEIGTLAIVWGLLEQLLASVLARMLRLSRMEGAIVAGNVELINQIRMIRHLAIAMKLESQWYSETKNLMSHIETDLCPERNRMFHDYWVDKTVAGNPAKMDRITMKPRSKDLKLEQPREENLTHEEVAELVVQVVDTNLRLMALQGAIDRHYEQ
jgi:hypothetical protein